MQKIEQILDTFQQAEKERELWQNAWQKASRFIHSTKNDFNNIGTDVADNGQVLTTELFDTTAVTASDQASGSLMGLMWGGANNVNLIPSKALSEEDVEVIDYFKQINDIMHEILSNKFNGLDSSLAEVGRDLVVLGTGGVGCYPDTEYDVVFLPYTVKNCYLMEGINGIVDTIFVMYYWNVKRIVQEYGIDNVSEDIKRRFEGNNLDEKYEILVAFLPEKMEGKKTTYKEIHIEKKSQFVLKTINYKKMPIYFTRLKKRIGEVYGRGWGIDALPDVLSLNQMMEWLSLYTHQAVQPAMGVFSDSDLGGKKINFSPNSISVFKPSSRIQGSPVFKTRELGDVNPTLKLVEDLRVRVQQLFHLDVLNYPITTKEMTLGETNLRDYIRHQVLTPITARQYSELFYPLFHRVVEILMEKKRFGVSVVRTDANSRNMLIVPNTIQELIKSGKKWYDIEFKTAAKTMEKSGEFESLNRFGNFIMQIAQIDPDVIYNVNSNQMTKIAVETSGTPKEVLNSAKQALALQQAAQQQRAAMMEQQMQLQQAQTQKMMRE